ncbi:MAG: CDP-diacylglycerol--glycerol-3-phosphate 3-phosphatidyltransferase [Chloroflexi bacterium]|nr:CDP-diacylglycerol--glycerol-3-phosphate 3-phosphatidyltransferase [Chloroflexota bacterium]
MPVGYATQLTLLRIALAPLIMFLVIWGEGTPRWYWLAAALLALGAATDWLDGFVARRSATVTSVGASLDLVADKVLVVVVLISLVQVELLPGWWAAVVVSREMAVTGLRAQAAEKGASIPAGRVGKLKTGVTFIALLVLLVWQGIVSDILLWLALALTVYSGGEYMYSGIRKIREASSAKATHSPT